MKEALAFAIFDLIKIGLVWIGCVVLSVVVAVKTRQTALKIVCVLVGIVSVPAYVLIQRELHQRAHLQNIELRKAAALASSKKWQEICATPMHLALYEPLPIKSNIDLRIQERQGGLFPLNLLEQISWPKKEICWLEIASDRCPQPPVSTVEWELRSDATWCTQQSPNKNCHRMWRFDIATQSLKEIGELTATISLVVSSAENFDTSIERFKISLSDLTSGTALGEVHVYRKTWFGDIAPYPGQDREPRHCPDRDKAVAALLSRALVLHPTR